MDGSHVGEQTLIARLVAEHPQTFAGRLFLFDRNYLGGALVAAILAAGGHVLMRVKSDITLPVGGWRRDRSYDSVLGGAEKPIPVRVVEYDVTAPAPAPAPAGAEGAEGAEGESAGGGQELFCLVTDLTDDEKYPAHTLSAAYPLRWSGSETTIKENKTTITDAGPSVGPIFRSATPDMIRQEFGSLHQFPGLIPSHWTG